MKNQAYNVRVIKKEDGTFEFPTGGYMSRCAKRGKGWEWIDASETDRKNLDKQLSKV